jgi:DNA-binding transcriptional ArsR family regulator
MYAEGFADLRGLRVPQVEVRPGGASARRTPRPAGQSSRPGFVHGRFLKGPIPLSWLGRACCLRGPKVVPVALAIRYLAGLRNCTEGLKLTSKTLELFGVLDRSTKTRALQSLEGAGLVRVVRRPGKNPLVTILEVEGAAGATSSCVSRRAAGAVVPRAPAH